MCVDFWKFGWKKTRKKKSKIMSVTERPIDRSVAVDLFSFFSFFFPLVSRAFGHWSTRTSDPRNYFISRHTFDREKREREERREKGEEREDGSVSLLVATMAQTRGTKDCFVLSLFILKKRNVYPLFSRLFYHLSPNRSLFYT